MTASTVPALRAVLLLERAEAWGNVRGLWEAMSIDPRFDPSVRVLPRIAAHGELSVDPAIPAMLAASGVPYQEIARDADAGSLSDVDILVVNHPYDRDRPAAFPFSAMRRQVGLIAYIPYGFVVGANRRNQHLQYAQPTQEGADAIFVRSTYEKRLYRSHCPRGDDHVHALGLPRLDDVAAFNIAQVDPELVQAIGTRTAILWNSHFSFAPDLGRETRYSTFDRFGGALFAFARRHPELALVWRPHPRLFDEAVGCGLLSASQVPALRLELLAAGIILDERPDHRHAFAVASALLTDPGSFLIEFLVTGKPMLLLRPHNGAALTDEAEDIIASIGEATTTFEIEAFIDRVLRGDDPQREQREMMRRRVLGMNDGHAGTRIANALAALARPIPPSVNGTPLMASMMDGLAKIASAKSNEPREPGRVSATLTTARGWLSHQVKRNRVLLSIARRLGLA